MTVIPERGLLRSQTTLFDHALRLHRENPNSPLPCDGEPYPDDIRHRRQPRPQPPKDPRLTGAQAAAVLDRHFANPSAVPADLADAFHDVYVPIQPNEHISAAACRAETQGVRETGRWLVRRATDRCSATIGLALLATVWDERDIPLIQTIGLLSNHFGPLAARALERRRGRGEALLWMADRVAGWGRVYIVESLCKVGGLAARPWLLRRACDGDALNGYFAGEVATVAHLHEAITAADPDDDLVDHTGRLLAVMTYCGGMGMTLNGYPPGLIVAEAYLNHVGRLEPTVDRYLTVAQLADYLCQSTADQLAWPERPRERILRGCRSLLERKDWSSTARAGIASGDRRITWLADAVAPRLGLMAFIDTPPRDSAVDG